MHKCVFWRTSISQQFVTRLTRQPNVWRHDVEGEDDRPQRCRYVTATRHRPFVLRRAMILRPHGVLIRLEHT